MTGFKNKKKSKAHLVRSQLPDLDEVGNQKSCERKKPSFHCCENMKDTRPFKSQHLDEIHRINKNYNCNTKMAVIECQIYGNLYTGSTKTNFRSMENNYESTHEKFKNKVTIAKLALKQEKITVQIDIMEDWVITLIDRQYKHIKRIKDERAAVMDVQNTNLCVVQSY